jgi:predicted nucleotidyltransferase
MLKKRIENLDEVLRCYIRELQKTIRVEKVFLFGSYAHHTEHDYSDIDVAVVSPDFEGGSEKDYLILGKAAVSVNALIEARPYRPEDLNDLSPVEFFSEIITKGKLIYSEAA